MFQKPKELKMTVVDEKSDFIRCYKVVELKLKIGLKNEREQNIY